MATKSRTKARYKLDPYRHTIVNQKTGKTVCTESDISEYFSKKHNTTKQLIKVIDDKIAELKIARQEIADKCKHLNLVMKYEANTGNYDPSQDRYWILFRCYDCDERWMEDQ